MTLNNFIHREIMKECIHEELGAAGGRFCLNCHVYTDDPKFPIPKYVTSLDIIRLAEQRAIETFGIEIYLDKLYSVIDKTDNFNSKHESYFQITNLHYEWRLSAEGLLKFTRATAEQKAEAIGMCFNYDK